MSRIFILILTLATACDGGVTEPPADGGGFSADAGDSPADAGGSPTDAGSCPVCTGDTPLCDTTSGACVECLADTDCGAGLLCEPSAQVCVECVGALQCASADAPSCRLGSCGGCTEDADCARFETSPYCEGTVGGCVACLEDAHCLDDDPCTIDMCNVDGTCSHEPDRECVVELTVGDGHACVRRASGTVDCWGRNSWGQLGDGSLTDRSMPTRVPLAGIGAIDADRFSTCAASRGGFVTCWGAASDFRLGLPASPANVTTPMPNGVSNATGVAAGGFHGCALRDDGGVWCWGSGEDGQLGDGALLTRFDAAPVSFLGGPVAEVVAGERHTCVRLDTGVVECFGRGDDGAIGDGGYENRAVPTAVLGVSDAIDLDAELSSCVVESGGRVACWGPNARGQLGDGTFDERPAPTTVPGLAATAVAVGRAHACAIRVGGQVACWGSNSIGQLGALGDGSGRSPSPIDVVGLDDAALIAAGGRTTCAQRLSGEIWCWGGNIHGQLGDGTTMSRHTPAPALGL